MESFEFVAFFDERGIGGGSRVSTNLPKVRICLWQ